MSPPRTRRQGIRDDVKKGYLKQPLPEALHQQGRHQHRQRRRGRHDGKPGRHGDAADACQHARSGARCQRPGQWRGDHHADGRTGKHGADHGCAETGGVGEMEGQQQQHRETGEIDQRRSQIEPREAGNREEPQFDDRLRRAPLLLGKSEESRQRDTGRRHWPHHPVS